MENQIICPNCKKVIAISTIISDEAKGKNSFSRKLVCDCGEKISYWRVAAQLQDHKKLSWKIHTWIQSLSHSRP